MRATTSAGERSLSLPLLLLTLYVTSSVVSAAMSTVFTISIVDRDTRRGIPLVLARTNSYAFWWSDSAGNIAISEPAFEGRVVFFTFLSDGYNVTAPSPVVTDGAAYDEGVAMVVKRDTTSIVTMTRVQPAERLFRLTGANLYKDTVLSGLPSPLSYPFIEPHTLITGQDTLILTMYRGRPFHVFGDTSCLQSARQDNCNGKGMYSVGATCAVWVPETSPELEYFYANGAPKPLAPMPTLSDNTWMGALSVVDRGLPTESLYAFYVKPGGNGGGDQSASGWVRWNDRTVQFEDPVLWSPTSQWNCLDGAKVVIQRPGNDDQDGYVYYAGPFVFGRASRAAIIHGNESDFEAWTPLTENSTVANPVIGGWAFRKGARIFSAEDEASLIARGILLSTDAKLQPKWMNGDGGRVSFGGGGVNWNANLQQWVMIAEGSAPNSGAGNQWISVAPTMTGPWTKVWRVATHAASGLSCYNTSPTPYLDDVTSSRVTFACTITSMWSNVYNNPSLWSTCLFKLNSIGNSCAPIPPDYEYNNMIYAVDVKALQKLK